jgi:predicted ATP-binding protein involved in virulence
MKVRRLEMKAFRGFSELTLEFNSQITVLVGVNGAGKTSILDCLALMLSQVVAPFFRAQSRWLDDPDIHTGKPYTRETIEVASEEQLISWSLVHMRKGSPQTVSNDLFKLQEFTDHLMMRLANEQQQLPLAMYYPVDRTPATDTTPRGEAGTPTDSARLEAYVGALKAGGRDFKPFFDWFRGREDLENEQRLQVNPAHRDHQLEAVRTAIEKLVPGFSGLRVQRAPLRMVVQKDGAPLELDQLSDGEKGLLALAGDLGRRLAIASPGLPEPLLAEAVVLIDEIELHLHPGWQRMVVDRLCQTFPNCQFILTTHSPQVLSQIPAESVVLLDRFQRVALPAGTLGRDSNSILAEVMGVPERPQASADQIHAVARMIDAGELPRARQALDALAKQLGEQDSEVVRLRALMGFLGG